MVIVWWGILTVLIGIPNSPRWDRRFPYISFLIGFSGCWCIWVFSVSFCLLLLPFCSGYGTQEIGRIGLSGSEDGGDWSQRYFSLVSFCMGCIWKSKETRSGWDKRLALVEIGRAGGHVYAYFLFSTFQFL